MLDPSYSHHEDDPFAPAAGAPLAPAGASGMPPAGKASVLVGVARIRTTLLHVLHLAKPVAPADRILLAVLVAADLALIAGYLAFAYAEHYGLRDSPFYGDLRFSFVEWAYPEMWGYAKQGLVALLLLGAYVARRQGVYRALALLFAVTLLDDSLALHETLGAYLAAGTGLSVRVGELVAWAAIGLVPLLIVLGTYRQADERGRTDAEAIVMGFAILLFFAVGMDVVHGIMQRFVTGFQTVLTVAEDGGELLALTLICAVAHGIFRSRRSLATATSSPVP